MPRGVENSTQVAIVGCGPVGLTLGVALGRLGVRCLLLERQSAPQFLPKMERCNARSMEIYRRMGLAERIRKAGLREDVPMDVFIVRSMVKPPLLHLPYPSVAQARDQIRACNDGSMPLEPYQLISQYTLEPILKEVAESTPGVTVRYGHELISLEQDSGGVTLHTKTADGHEEALRADYVVGCDGGNSVVRKQLGIKLRGEYNLLELRQALFRCNDLYEKIPIGSGPGRGRHYHVADDKATFLIMQDSTKHFTLHSVVNEDADMAGMFEKTIGIPIQYEMLACLKWRQNLLLAERYQDGRVFLAGDSAHLVIPTGGLGMNSGVGDAIDLAWKLAGVLAGWGGPNLLRSYELERRQIGDRNIGASRYASLGRRRWRSQYDPVMNEETPAGESARSRFSALADIEQRKSNEMIGAELGYRYVDSPIICDIPGGPEHLFREYKPTTWPGARLPHVWLGDGRSIQDIVGDGYTILKLGRTKADTSNLERALTSFGAPVSRVNVPDDNARDIYGYDVLLLRPDLHIVWRGNAVGEDAYQIASTATGQVTDRR